MKMHKTVNVAVEGDRRRRPTSAPVLRKPLFDLPQLSYGGLAPQFWRKIDNTPGLCVILQPVRRSGQYFSTTELRHRCQHPSTQKRSRLRARCRRRFAIAMSEKSNF
jgi:hypothetical protein